MMATDPKILAQLLAVNPQAQMAQQRSKYLTEALQAIQASSNKISSPGELGTKLLADALLQYGLNKSNKDVIAGQVAARQQLTDLGKHAFPNDPVAATMFSLDPDAGTATYLKRYDPMDAREGSTVLNGPNGPQQFIPKHGVEGGVPYTIGSDGGTQWGQQRPQNHAEDLTAAGQQETVRNHVVMEGQGQQHIGIDLGQLGVAQGNLGVNRGRLQLETSVAPMAGPPAGYVLDQPGK
jgi:hypothetical protein